MNHCLVIEVDYMRTRFYPNFYAFISNCIDGWFLVWETAVAYSQVLSICIGVMNLFFLYIFQYCIISTVAGPITILLH